MTSLAGGRMPPSQPPSNHGRKSLWNDSEAKRPFSFYPPIVAAPASSFSSSQPPEPRSCLDKDINLEKRTQMEIVRGYTLNVIKPSFDSRLTCTEAHYTQRRTSNRNQILNSGSRFLSCRIFTSLSSSITDRFEYDGTVFGRRSASCQIYSR